MEPETIRTIARDAQVNHAQLVEIAIKAPETVAETGAETDLRLRAEYMYHKTHPHGLCTLYEAGWKAAKAYYEGRQ